MQGRDFFMAWRIVRKHHRQTAEQAKSLDRPRQTGRQNSPNGIFADHSDSARPNPYPRQAALRDEARGRVQSVNTSRGRDSPRADVAHASRRYRRLIQPTTVQPPAILSDTRPCAARVRSRFRRAPLQPRVRAMTVIQVDNATPIGLRREKSRIRGIRGSVVLSSGTTCASSRVIPCVGAASRKGGLAGP